MSFTIRELLCYVGIMVLAGFALLLVIFQVTPSKVFEAIKETTKTEITKEHKDVKKDDIKDGK
ncbi:MAG: hypothetical protein ACLTFB_00875 [Candidatus Phytoplasma pyri]